MAKVQIEVIGNAWGALGLMWHVGKREWIDEKQAEIGVDMGVFKIIGKHAPVIIPDAVATKEETKPAEESKPAKNKPGRKPNK